MAHLQSSGRGGAGNIVDSTKSPKIQPQDLETPTLKSSVVTTGRGGSGNMTKNTDPAETRALQDVKPVARRPSQGATHVGRGGTGNVFNPDEVRAAKEEQQANGVADEDEDAAAAAAAATTSNAAADPEPLNSQPGWAEKSKQFLFGKR